MFIDADAHVDECADTWTYFPKSASDFRPVDMRFEDGEGPDYIAKSRPSTGIFVDGELYRRVIRDDEETNTTLETRELRDIPTRLRQMDELDVDVQVLYPTLLLKEVTRRPEVEVAVCESYNRWIADRCSESNGRLRWVATVPYHSIDDARREMRRAKDEGAIGILKRGVECDERRSGSPYFHPIYELAQELDLPVCMHVAHPHSGVHNSFTKTQPAMFTTAYTIDGFLSLLMDGVAKRFPQLRFGFIEAAASWLPYALWLSSFEQLFSNRPGEHANRRGAYAQVLEDARFYVTCEATEDLPYVLSVVGDNQLCVGTDYGHSDRAAIRLVHSEVMQNPDIDPKSAEKLTSVNGRALYGLA